MRTQPNDTAQATRKDRSRFVPDVTRWLDVTQGDIDPAPQYLRVSNCGRVVDTWGREV